VKQLHAAVKFRASHEVKLSVQITPKGHFTMQCIASRTKGALLVPQAHLTQKNSFVKDKYDI